MLANQRHELFAQALAKGKTADEAYRLAGYNPNRGNACTLKANQNVAKRVAELQAKPIEYDELSKQWVIKRLIENANRAMQIEQPADGGEYRYDGSVANRALELLGKELGMFVERTENVNHNYELSDRMPTAEEWEAEHATPPTPINTAH